MARLKTQKHLSIAIGLLLCLTLLVSGGYYKFTHHGNGQILMTAASRELPEGTILDSEVPLAGDLPNTSTIEYQIYMLVNNQRTAAGLAEVVWSNILTSDANVRASEASVKWSHTRPNGTQWWTVDSNSMYGENLAKGYTTADAAVAAWMNSPSHKANILDSGFRTMGISTYTDANGTVYIAQEFGY